MTSGAVVVGVDVPGTSGAAVLWAADAAARHGVPLRMVHAADEVTGLPVGDVSDADDSTRELLSQTTDDPSRLTEAVASARARQPDLEIEPLAVVDDAVTALLELQDHALLVVGTGRRNALSELVLGSTSLGVAMHASSPVAVVPPAVEDAREPVGVVAVAVDGSPDSVVAARVACAEALARGARVVALNTWALEVVDGFVVTESDEREYAAIRDRQTALVERVLGPSREAHPELDIEVEIVNGPVVRTLVERTETVDLLVLGSRGRGGFTGKLLGSVSQKVLRGAQCPVIIAKAGPRG